MKTQSQFACWAWSSTLKATLSAGDGHKKSVSVVPLPQESWYEFRVMAVMDDLISESSNVVGVSSTGQFYLKETLQTTRGDARHCDGYICEFCACNFSPSSTCLPNQIPSPLPSCLMRGWQGQWWRGLWRLSVFWQQQSCSALSQLALSISNTAANSNVNQVGVVTCNNCSITCLTMDWLL